MMLRRGLPLFVVAIPVHHAVVLMHEYSHSFMAWALGDKLDPFVIDWGGTGLLNLLTLLKISEHVDYDAIFASVHPWHAALIGIAGSGIGNVVSYLISKRWLRDATSSNYPFAFWTCFFSVANFYDYVPLRTFTDHGDMGHIAVGLGVSHWLVFLVLIGPVLWTTWDLFFRELPRAYSRLGLSSAARQRSLLLACAILFFVYYGNAGRFENPISHWLANASMLMAIPVTALLWPRQPRPSGS